MILQALKEYYDRKDDLPRLGFESKEIPYLIILKADGTSVDIKCTTEGNGKKRRSKVFTVPQSVKRSRGILANLLWDNPEYVLGTENHEKHAAFKAKIGLLANCQDEGLVAIRNFLSHDDKIDELKKFDSWKALVEDGANVSFQLDTDSSDKIILNRPSVRAAIETTIHQASDGHKSICLVTGQDSTIERLHASIKGVWGAKTSGANILSFNQDSFTSFRKNQGDNAPVSKQGAFAYTTALNYLLGKDSKQRLQVGETSTVFWSAKSTSFEEHFSDFFAEPPKDDPERGVQAVTSLLQAVKTGAFYKDDSQTKFYVLGLAPNASRISIRFWHTSTIAEMAGRTVQHFEDIKTVHGPKDKDVLSLFRLLVSTATQGKSENISPNLAGETMRAILEGLPYPQTLLQAAVRRIRAEHEVTYPRAAIIKACLNRYARFYNTKGEELKMSLDKENKNIGYRLGRLFAVLEKIQIRKFTQNGGKEPNSTIKDKYYGAASSTPSTVFSTLIRLSNYHLAGLENRGERTNLEKLKTEIFDGFCDFPPHLKLEDQGRFAIGYYHQKQDFFTKKNNEQSTQKGEVA